VRDGERSAAAGPALEREKIMEAAYRILAADERAALSVAEVLAEAGLSTRAFYRYFDSKDTLLRAMFRRDSERVLAELQATAAATPNAVEALRSWIYGMVRLTAEPRRRQRALVLDSAEVTRAKGHRAERARYEAAMDAVLTQILHRGRAEGSFPLGRPALDARYLRAVLDQAVRDQMSAHSPLDADEAAGDLFDFAVRALAGHPAT
jgi:AcrR family transcriptional regulator